MEIIDAQLIAWAPHSDEYPWDAAFLRRAPTYVAFRDPEQRSVSVEELRAMMRAVGVDRALLYSPIVYGANHTYALDAAERYPESFGVVGPVFPTSPGVEDYVRTFRERPGAVGVRLLFVDKAAGSPLDDMYAPIYRAAERGAVPIFLTAPGQLPAVGELARRYSDVRFVVDHFGQHLGGETFSFTALPDLLQLARSSNVSVKCTGGPSFSREPFPFPDVWPLLDQIFAAFGHARTMWGSDITRLAEYTYCQALDYLRNSDRLTAEQKELLLGAALRENLRWPS